MAKKTIAKVTNKANKSSSSKSSSSKSSGSKSSGSKSSGKKSSGGKSSGGKSSGKKTTSKKTTSKKTSNKSFTTSTIAKNAANTLTKAVDFTQKKYDDLNSYVTNNDTLRKDYKRFMDYDDVLGKYNEQSDAAWELAKQEQMQALNAAEYQNVANTRNAIGQMRNALAGSAASGANQGAANATALQALLGMGQQNANTTTEGMQGYQNAAKEAAAARAANAVSALEMNKTATDSMYDAATSAYGSDREAMGQAAYGAGGGLGTVAAGVNSDLANVKVANLTNASNERMNRDTNKTNIKVAKTPTTQTVINKKK